MAYNFKQIGKKWQKKWEEKKVFEAKEKGKKFYVLEMYPYPSGTGLHMGHAFNYTIGDVYARFKRMQGFNVLHPMGYDSFGLPAENAAIKAKSHPRVFTDEAIKSYIKQQKELGFSYDWSRILQSHDENYYKWNQWIFLKMFEKGLAYKKKAVVNYCRKCDTVLANEQVHNGKCWRHTDTEIEVKHLEQWFLKITDYAEELLKDVDSLDWPEKIKTMQRNWIGKSEGAEAVFEINKKKFFVFTTRIDTLFGVTFLAISPQYIDLEHLITKEKKKEVEKFLKKIKSTKQEDIDKMEKSGVFTGSYAIHPLTKERIPVWIANFVLAEYGSGIVMGVPSHDKRDFEFARKYKLPIKIVIRPENEKIQSLVMDEAYTGSGKLINSLEFNGLFSEEAKEHITKVLREKKLGGKKIHYKLRDWLISRQRYWGTPIPMLYDEKGNIVPVPESELPVKLPNDVKFGKGNPLETSKIFLTVKKNGKIYRRETDTMDTFFDSSWYFLRFIDSKNQGKMFDMKKADYWMPVDFYTGGAEHACMHLIYARFFTKVLRDLNLVGKKLNEPFKRLFNQGMVHAEDGFVMSKSKGNVIDPMEMAEKYGADTLRLFLVSIASPDSDFSWNQEGIEGMHRFVRKLFEYFSKVKTGKSNPRTENKIHGTIKNVTEEIENLKYNLAIIKIRNLFEYLHEREISRKDLETCIKMLAPFTPHVAEEFWEKLGNKNFVSFAEWPKYDEKKISKEFEKEEKDVEDLIGDVLNVLRIVREREKKPKKLFVYTLPKEKEIYANNIDEIERRTNLQTKVFAVNEKGKHDPDGKSKKAKPGKPAIYLE
ncbi:leucine--tRNA ligase [Candidatus Pacearchaeota archaeon]|nr:leucine--tRNA ligase [Candidatus Pacearchaeota archaeon]